VLFRSAHALRNSAGMLRLSALHGLCDALEQAAGRPAAEPDVPLPDLQDLLDRLLPLLEAGVARVRAVTDRDGESRASNAIDTATPGAAPAKETGH
ncbi:Hpt domain-containing protein, partial [Nitratidesulfovibrio liaohensis]|uniref:Hpt domain-containing protein n=1 Tax=Nitratidesulfovibrio liaohensis TaxID=2604158 RepID=UPI0014249732